MTFISSPKPAGVAEADRNQKIAHATWKQIATHIVYLGAPQDDLTCPKTFFIETEDFPPISKMAQLAARQATDTWVAILNADIRVKPTLYKAVEELERRKKDAATSYRWQIHPLMESEPKVLDNGLDFFIARPKVWADAWNKMPKDLRMGSQLWDTWMLSFLATFYCETYSDLTPSKIIFHPVHEIRNYGPQPKMPQLWSHPVMSPNKVEI